MYKPCYISIYSWDIGAGKEEENPKKMA